MTQKLEQTAQKGFGRSVAEAISESVGEPGWARERRLEAWRVYEDTPMPARTDEAWRRTDLSPLRLEALAPYVPSTEGLPDLLKERLAAVPDRAGFVAQVNSQSTNTEVCADWQPRGVIFTSLERALREYPELVEPYLLEQGLLPNYNKFAALNGAFWSGGAFLYVPKNLVIDTPFLSARTLIAQGGAVIPRTIIVVESGSSIVYVDQSASESREGQALHCGVTDIFLKENAELRYASVQEWGRDLWDFSLTRANLGAGARFFPVLVNLGAQVSRLHLEAIMAGRGAEARLQGVYFGGSDQHFDFRTLQDHVSPFGTSDLKFKGALKNKASAAYEGTVHVAKGAIRTSANQENRNLLLNPGAKADSVPILEIEASDIDKCSHGATVGQVDESQLFYLMSRGLSRKEAEELAVAGFFDPIIDAIPLQSLQDRLRAVVGEKLAL